MATYIYEIVRDDGQPGDRFEVVQKMSDPPLTSHPESGQPVRRVFTPPWIAGKLAPMRTDRTLASDSKLESLGFTKYVKSGDGYDKVVGGGPDVIQRPGR